LILFLLRFWFPEPFGDLIWPPDDVLAELDARQAQLLVEKREEKWSVEDGTAVVGEL
jgi:hypothetical protein